MNRRLKVGKKKRILLWCFLFLLWFPPLFLHTLLGIPLTFISGFLAVIGSFLIIIFLIRPISAPSRMQTKPARSLPDPPSRSGSSIPGSATEAHRTMTDGEFELFSAAVVIAVERNRGLTFVKHTGKSGDGGADVLLRNAWGGTVIIQAKRYANSVGAPALTHFKGALGVKNAVYGFFVTTSRFTKPAQLLIADPDNRIHGIDGQKLDLYLHSYRDAIAQTYRELQHLIRVNAS